MEAGARLLVVGSSGFIGGAVVDLMARRGLPGVAASRRGDAGARGPVRRVAIPGYDDRAAMAAAATGCQAAIILAGRAHVTKADAGDAAAFMRANHDLPLAVAEAFADAGGRRLVLVSSVSVNGVATPGAAFRESDPPAPVNDYGRSKLSGERALERSCAARGLELVIVRPPLVYGPDAPGNFGRLLRAAKRGTPLPLGSIANRRDYIGIDNLADLLLLAATHSGAGGHVFLASDGEEISTSALARHLYRAAGHERRLLPCPPALLRAAAAALGRSETAGRLLDDLRIDSGLVRATLGWTPPLTLAEGLERSVREGGA